MSEDPEPAPPGTRVTAVAPRLAPPGSRRGVWRHRMTTALRILVREGPLPLARRISNRHSRGLAGNIETRTPAEQYQRWRALNEPDAEAIAAMRSDHIGWQRRPLISIRVPVNNPQRQWLDAMINSVVAQTYPEWELWLVDHSPTRDDAVASLADYAARDRRIKIRGAHDHQENTPGELTPGSTGDFVAFLAQHDVLRPFALHAFVELLQIQSDVDVAYSDEDRLLADGSPGEVFFKPDWSPELLLSTNYMGHFVVMRKDLVGSVGGLQPEIDACPDLDLLLRVTERANHIAHIPQVLCSSRMVASSPIAGRSDTTTADRQAISDALQRRGWQATVKRADATGRYRVRVSVVGTPRVSIVIPTRDRLDLLHECLSSIETLTTYQNYDITIVDNDSVSPETLQFLDSTPHRVVRSPGPFNYSHIVNVGVSHTTGEHVLLLNNDVQILTADWIEALLEYTQQPEIGIAGARLLFPDGTPQHEGIGVGNVCGGYIAANLDAGWLGGVVRDVSAVTGACMMVRRDVYMDAGGFDETLPVTFNDVDFCLRVRRAGYRIVYTPFAELTHRESASRGNLDPPQDYAVFWDRWGKEGGIYDPFLGPHIRSLNPLRLRLEPLVSDR